MKFNAPLPQSRPWRNSSTLQAILNSLRSHRGLIPRGNLFHQEGARVEKVLAEARQTFLQPGRCCSAEHNAMSWDP